MGMGIMKTLILGAIIANMPPSEKMAPEAPMAMAKRGARSIKRIFPTMPPRKYTMRNLFSPINWITNLPRKKRLIMLQKMCPKPPCTKRLVMIVQG